MSTEPRTITLPTIDHGPVTLEEPAWCVGHAHHDPQSQRADLTHAGPLVECIHLGRDLLGAEIVQHPFSTSSAPELGGPTPGVSVFPLGKTLTPVQLYDLAATLDTYADKLRDLADQLHAILDGGESQ